MRYAEKRDFDRTPEPPSFDDRASGSEGRRFAVQEHDASSRHFDFRLELDGALKSWAIPKGPSLDPGEKRLAISTEDHPVSYASFEGTIPEDEYGGGTVLLWDRGTWKAEVEDPGKALDDGKLSFELDGERLSGSWALVRMNSDADQWLLIKHDDRASSRGEDAADRASRSVKTGRELAELREESPTLTAVRNAVEPLGLPGASFEPSAPELEPALCTLVDDAPRGDAWLHEPKLDGYRLLARRDDDGVQLLTRNGKNWTEHFPPVARALEVLPAERFLLDGELCAVDEEGRSSFRALPEVLREERWDRLRYYVFDILQLEEARLLETPLIRRKELLRELLERGGDDAHLRYTEHLRDFGESVYRGCCELGLEGMISKRIDAPYRSGRSQDWLKLKCFNRQELIIVGYTEPEGERVGFGALLLGAYDADGCLRFAGRCGTGFDDETLETLAEELASIETELPPIECGFDGRDDGVHWVAPERVCEVEFTEWTSAGRLRHPSFQGMRRDKEAQRVTIERSEERAEATVEGVSITHPDRILFSELGATKLQLAEWYNSIGEYLAPHVVNRPLSVIRCPGGVEADCFFQRHIDAGLDNALDPITIEEGGESHRNLMVRRPKELVSLAQYGVVELHPWGVRHDDLDRPDRVIFDLDPGDGVGFDDVKTAARQIRDLLNTFDLRCFVKTTGGAGLHVVVPFARRAGWERASRFAKGAAQLLAEASPERYTTHVRKEQRRGRILLDTARNARGQTAVAAYSPRAKPGAPVAMPLSWRELDTLASSDAFSLETAFTHVEERGEDPWAELSATRQQLTPGRLSRLEERLADH